jgi:hypothetical protein
MKVVASLGMRVEFIFGTVEILFGGKQSAV